MGRAPRVVAVSSEMHRHVEILDIAELGERPESYGMGDAMKFYGRSKSCLNTWTFELARRFKEGRVHAICPGAVSSEIQRDAPWYIYPFVSLFMKLFQSPNNAALPVSAIVPSFQSCLGAEPIHTLASDFLSHHPQVVALGLPHEYSETSSQYYLMWYPLQSRADTVSVERGRAIWSRVVELLRRTGWQNY